MSLLHAAHVYREDRKAVLATSRKKVPLLSEWKSLQSRWPTDEEIEGWFANPDAQLAMITGAISNNMHVLDVDDTALAARMREDPVLLEQTTVISTPRGGIHLWVVSEENEHSGPLIAGVADLKAEGGYVLVPPSHSNDGAYEFISDGPAMRVQNSRRWALALLKEYGVEPKPAAPPQPQGDDGARPGLDVARELADLVPGNRNDTVARIAGKLHTKGLAAAEIVALLEPHVVARDFPRSELEKTVDSICRKPRGATGGQPANAEDLPPFEAVALEELLSREEEPIDAVIGDGGDGAILTTDGKGFVAGPTGVGKTNLLLRLSRCLAEGTPFLGLPIPEPRSVLYLALEGSPGRIRRRLRKIWAGADPETRERFRMASIMLNLANEIDLQRLEALLETVRPEVVIIDPLRNAHQGDENTSQDATRLTSILDVLIDRYHIAIICAHHDRKRPPLVRRDAGTDRVRGSTALTGWLQFCLSIDPDPKERDTLSAEWTKTRDSEVALQPFTLEFDRETLDFFPTERTPKGRLTVEAVVNAVAENGGSYRGPDLIAGFMAGAGVGERTVRSMIRAAVNSGQLVEYEAPEDKKHHAKSYRLSESEPEEICAEEET